MSVQVFISPALTAWRQDCRLITTSVSSVIATSNEIIFAIFNSWERTTPSYRNLHVINDVDFTCSMYPCSNTAAGNDDRPCKYGIWRKGVFSISSVYWLDLFLGLRSPASPPNCHEHRGEGDPSAPTWDLLKAYGKLKKPFLALISAPTARRFVCSGIRIHPHSFWFCSEVLLSFFRNSIAFLLGTPKELQKNSGRNAVGIWNEPGRMSVEYQCVIRKKWCRLLFEFRCVFYSAICNVRMAVAYEPPTPWLEVMFGRACRASMVDEIIQSVYWWYTEILMIYWNLPFSISHICRLSHSFPAAAGEMGPAGGEFNPPPVADCNA